MSPQSPHARGWPDERSALPVRSSPQRAPTRRDPAPDPDELRLLEQVLARTLAPGARKVAARDLLRVFGTAASVVSADAPDLVRTAGLSAGAISDLKILRQLSVDLARTEACRRPVISSWTALLTYARGALAHQPREQFRALYLDRRNILIRDEFVADGSVDHAPVYPREVIRRALEVSASSLILVHNHPSGDPAPSQADIAMTRQIIDGAKVFGLQVHDHLIVGREGTASFRSLGLI